MLAIAVEPGHRVGAKASGDTDDRSELQTREGLHEGAGVCILGRVCRFTKIGTNEPQATQRESVTLILQREGALIAYRIWILGLLRIVGSVVDGFRERVTRQNLKVILKLAIERNRCAVVRRVGGTRELVDGVALYRGL